MFKDEKEEDEDEDEDDEEEDEEKGQQIIFSSPRHHSPDVSLSSGRIDKLAYGYSKRPEAQQKRERERYLARLASLIGNATPPSQSKYKSRALGDANEGHTTSNKQTRQ